MKIQTRIFETREREIEIEFPIYKVQHLDSVSVFTMVESPEKETKVRIKMDGTNIEVEFERPCFDGNGIDFTTGQGKYKSSSEEFNKALALAADFISRIITDKQ
jgi:hypothetical protein